MIWLFDGICSNCLADIDFNLCKQNNNNEKVTFGEENSPYPNNIQEMLQVGRLKVDELQTPQEMEEIDPRNIFVLITF
jgi:hypothetical protein